MRLPTVIISVGLHVGLAVGLVAVAQKRELHRRAISVAVQDEKKKAKPPKPPAPPKPIAHPAIAKVEPVAPKAVSAAPVAHAAAAPVAMNLAMSNADLDVGPGIGLEGRAKPTAAPVKVASAISERAHPQRRARRPVAAVRTRPVTRRRASQSRSFRPRRSTTASIRRPRQTGSRASSERGSSSTPTARCRIVIVVAGVDPALDAAIMAALKRWRFKPAMACGKPVAGAMCPHACAFELGDYADARRAFALVLL